MNDSPPKDPRYGQSSSQAYNESCGINMYNEIAQMIDLPLFDELNDHQLGDNLIEHMADF